MKETIIEQASKKIDELSQKYNGFVNVILDDWRGWRFIFDTEDVRKCDNDCQACPLYQVLKDEKENTFSTSLYQATKEDKKIFGPQNFLNCKTIEQYKNCYINFLIQRANTKKEIIDELNLIKNTQVIFSSKNNAQEQTKKFKKEIIQKILKLADKRKRDIVNQYLNSTKL